MRHLRTLLTGRRVTLELLELHAKIVGWNCCVCALPLELQAAWCRQACQSRSWASALPYGSGSHARNLQLQGERSLVEAKLLMWHVEVIARGVTQVVEESL